MILYLLFVFGLTKIRAEVDISLVNYYKNLINNGIQNAVNFQLPTDARIYEATSFPVFDYGFFDFVIIGGGTAGSVLTKRLTERQDFNVLLLEAGNFSDDGFEQFLRYSLNFQVNTNLNWGYMSIPQRSACLGFLNESCAVPRGKGVGGSTLINACVYSRGNPENYDTWAAITKDTSWKYNNILKYFKKSENFHWTNHKAPVDLKYHGQFGPIQVQHKIPDFYLSDSFLEANKKFGIYPTDYNSPNQLGTSVFQLSTNRGKREDMGSIFVKPILKSRNLRVLTGAYVTKIEISNITKEAERVLFTYRGKTYRVTAKKEVILSAGSISSPHILMLSGIGPKNHLKELNIDLLQDLEVGTVLQDHPSISLRISSNLSSSQEDLNIEIREYLNGRGNLTAFPVPQSIGFYNFNSSKINTPNIEIVQDIAQASEEEIKLTKIKRDVYDALWGNNGSHVKFVINNIGPKSFGTLKLRSKNAFEYPLIDLRLLTDPYKEDLEALYQGIKFVFGLTETEDYKKFGLKYLAGPLPPCRNLHFKSREYWYCYIRQVTQTFYHPVSSCKMGFSKHTGAVVDSNLKVFGIDKLRVVDASIFPTTINGHTSMSVVMVAEKISDVIKSKYNL